MFSCGVYGFREQKGRAGQIDFCIKLLCTDHSLYFGRIYGGKVVFEIPLFQVNTCMGFINVWKAFWTLTLWCKIFGCFL